MGQPSERHSRSVPFGGARRNPTRVLSPLRRITDARVPWHLRPRVSSSRRWRRGGADSLPPSLRSVALPPSLRSVADGRPTNAG